MRPLLKTPRWGTVGAGQSWFLVAALMLYSPAVTLPLLMGCTYAVTLCAAWKKRPSAFWRTFVIASFLAGIYLSLFVAPQNEAIVLDGVLVSPFLVGAVYLGLSLAPLALVSCVHTAIGRSRS